MFLYISPAKRPHVGVSLMPPGTKCFIARLRVPSSLNWLTFTARWLNFVSLFWITVFCRSLTAILQRQLLYVHFLNNSIHWLIAPLRAKNSVQADRNASNFTWWQKCGLIYHIIDQKADCVSVTALFLFFSSVLALRLNTFSHHKHANGDKQSCWIHLNNLFDSV